MFLPSLLCKFQLLSAWTDRDWQEEGPGEEARPRFLGTELGSRLPGSVIVSMRGACELSVQVWLQMFTVTSVQKICTLSVRNGI